MYKIEPFSYGIRIALSGGIEDVEAENLCSALEAHAGARHQPFGLMLDCTNLIPFTPAVLTTFAESLTACVRLGCIATVTVVDSPVIRGQVVQIGHLAGFSGKGLIIDAAKALDWEEMAASWLSDTVSSLQRPAQRPQA